jgi:hypothetical protein
MKDTNKLVLGVTGTFVAISAIAVSQGGSLIVSAACTLTAVALSLAYKYKCERDNGLDLLAFMQKALRASNGRINILENALTDKLNDAGCKYTEPTPVTPATPVEVTKKPRRYKSKPKTEVVA